MASRPTIIVSGMIAADPHQGGATWAVLQFVLGLSALGYEVFLVEPIESKSLQPAGSTLAESMNATYFQQVMADFSFSNRAALLLANSDETVGLDYRSLVDVARNADMLLNISGMLTDRRLLEPIHTKVYLDLDPAFIQVWHSQGIDMRFDGHTHFVTIGQAIGEPVCKTPTCGKPWIKTWQPIDLSHWPVSTEHVPTVCTTVGNWRGYGSVHYNGLFLGQKAHSLRPIADLPWHTDVRFRLAMAIHPQERDDLEILHQNGWQLIDPHEVAGTPAEYQQFIQQSWAEFGIAKSGYVASRCGWFSDRSVAYLASGRPVLAQETGFSRYLPTGEGILPFAKISDVCAGLRQLQQDYELHANAARRMAEIYFSHDRVLPQLLDQIAAVQV